MRKAFTLIELLLVISIMGVMGTAAVGGYRAMQRGMEERGVLQNVNQFVRAAFQRAQIDRAPVLVCFWNETLTGESETNELVVVGKAVAVRQAGRITKVQGSDLIDEFGDLRFQGLTPKEGEVEDQDEDLGDGKNAVYLYPMNGAATQIKRSLVSQIAKRLTLDVTLTSQWASTDKSAPIDVYAYHVLDPGGVNWTVGQPYGLEFAEIKLPTGYIFGTSYSSSESNPMTSLGRMMFRPNRIIAVGSGTIQIAALRANAAGGVTAFPIGTSEDPRKELE